MKKISSDFTFFYKRIFPITWLGIVALFELVGIAVLFISNTPINGKVVLFITVPVLLFVLGFYLFFNLVFHLIDEVYFDDASLLLVNRNRKTRILFSDIEEISYQTNRPQRIEVILYEEDKKLGKTLYFIPPTKLLSFQKHPDIERLFEKFKESKS